jgi:hypothetical protein
MFERKKVNQMNGMFMREEESSKQVKEVLDLLCTSYFTLLQQGTVGLSFKLG